jgi:hypothetical protein
VIKRRVLIRNLVGETLDQVITFCGEGFSIERYGRRWHWCQSTNDILRFLLPVVHGFSPPLKQEHRRFWLANVLPLYRTHHQLVLFFEASLLQVMAEMLRKDASLEAYAVAEISACIGSAHETTLEKFRDHAREIQKVVVSLRA